VNGGDETFVSPDAREAFWGVVRCNRRPGKPDGRWIHQSQVEGGSAEDRDRDRSARVRIDHIRCRAWLNVDFHRDGIGQYADDCREPGDTGERCLDPTRIDQPGGWISGDVKSGYQIAGNGINAEEIDSCPWNGVVA
jgi:hypothetical protein